MIAAIDKTDREPLDAAFTALEESAPESNLDERGSRIISTIKGMMAGYHIKWNEQKWTTLSIEEEFHVPIYNPESGAKSRLYTFAGKFDGTVTDDTGRVYLLEHKTTSQDILDPSSSYWRQLLVDSQINSYMLAGHIQGREFAGVVYDVVRKPSIKPKRISKKDQSVLLSHGLYLDVKVSNEARSLDFESPELFGIRVTKEYLSNPNRFYQRRTVHRLESEVIDFATELSHISEEVYRTELHGTDYRNSASCHSFNTPCEYLSLCSNHDSEDSGNWAKQGQVHSELDSFGDGGLTVLTNSRIKCFQSCRRKHTLRYIKRLRRSRDEEKEALYFGRLWHIAQEAWWSCFKG